MIGIEAKTTYVADDLEALAGHFEGMIPALDRERIATTTKRDQMVLLAKIETLREVARILRKTELRSLAS